MSVDQLAKQCSLILLPLLMMTKCLSMITSPNVETFRDKEVIIHFTEELALNTLSSMAQQFA